MKFSKLNPYIYDVCGTLYESNTTFDFCKWRCKNIYWLIMMRLSSCILGKLVNKFFCEFLGFELSRYIHLKSLSNTPKDILYRDAAIFVNEFLKDRCIISVCDLLNNDISNNNNVILVSASIDPIIYAISKKFGNVPYVSSTLDYNSDDCCTGKLFTDLLGVKEDLNFIDIKKVVTDNISDFSLCRYAEKSVIIINDKNKKFWVENKLKGMIFHEY